MGGILEESIPTLIFLLCIQICFYISFIIKFIDKWRESDNKFIEFFHLYKKDTDVALWHCAIVTLLTISAIIGYAKEIEILKFIPIFAILILGILVLFIVITVELSTPTEKEQIEDLKRKREYAEENNSYGSLSKVELTDYYAESMYYYLDMNRMERKMSEITKEQPYDYFDAYRLVMIEETPDELQKDIVEKLERLKTENTSAYNKFMSEMNKNRPSFYPEYKKAKDVKFYLSQCEIAAYHARQWIISKGFKPYDFERAVRYNNGHEPPPYPNPLNWRSKDEYYKTDYGEYTSYELKLDEEAWFYGPGQHREIHFPTKYGWDMVWSAAQRNLKYEMKAFPWGKRDYSKWSKANIYDENFVKNNKKLKELLKDTQMNKNVSQQSVQTPSVKPVSDSWTCSCGNVNTGKTCLKCGKKQQ